MDSHQKGSSRISVPSDFLFHPAAPIYLDEYAKPEHAGTLRLHVPVRAFLCCLFSRLIRGEAGCCTWPAARIPQRGACTAHKSLRICEQGSIGLQPVSLGTD